MWTAADTKVAIDDETSAGSVVTVRISMPAGDPEIIADIESFGRELVLSGLHIQTETLRANSLGWARVRQIARAVAEIADVDAVVVKGAARTTGARYGRVPGSLRFTRRYLGVAKRQVEQMLLGDEVAIDLPMLEDATAFESELHELGIIAVREAPAAAAEG
jgi:hypothetical protein